MDMLLDVRLSALVPNKQLFAWVYFPAVLAGNILFMLTIGQPRYGEFYFFLAQLPLFIGFSIVSRYRGIKLVFVLLSTVIFSAPPRMCVLMAQALLPFGPAASTALFLLCSAAMLLIVWRFLKEDFHYMLENCAGREFWLFCLIPIFHYVYIFSRTKYDFTGIAQTADFWSRQLPTLIVLVSYILLVRIFRSTRENQRLQNEAAMIHTQMEAADLRLQELNRAQEQTREYRHNMRHHFSLLQALVSEGDLDRIAEYLHSAQSDLDTFTPTRYCENETANLLLSSFEAKAKRAGVTLTVDAKLPEALPLSDTELCSLLANSLENAVTAAAALPPACKKAVAFWSAVHQEKLLLSVENPYGGQVTMQDGLPRAAREGHGYGVRSIAAIAETHGGQALFSADDGVFSLKVVLPLKAIRR